MLLIFAPAGAGTVLIISSILGGFRQIAGYTVTTPMMIELVPREHIGRWRGFLGLINGLIAIPAPLIGGYIWNTYGPMYLMALPLVLDICLRFPILTTIPERQRPKKGYDG